jgi:uncharacterized membrane protein YesL
MNLYDNKFYNYGVVISDFILLNLLWFLMCLPIITIFPSTAAMFGVVRKWKRGQSSPVFTTFFRCFKENFKQSFVIGFIATLIGVGYFLNFKIIAVEKNLLVYLLLVSTFMLFILTMIYIFPIMVNYKNTTVNILKNSLYFSLISPLNSFLLLVVIASSYTIVYFIPFAIIITVSLTAYFVFMICSKTFKKIEHIKGITN